MNGTDQVIEAMLIATYPNETSERNKNIYREALRGLVRLAKAEQLLQMNVDMERVTSGQVLRH